MSGQKIIDGLKDALAGRLIWLSPKDTTSSKRNWLGGETLG